MIDDTIVALSTPPGQGALGVIRLSGPAALSVCLGVFRPSGSAAAGHGAGSVAPRAAVTGSVVRPGTGEFLDRAVMTYYPAPGSYTGEDVAELSCHGNPFLLREILKILIGSGARPAKPGEFTERAYLNGKMDLSEAEAVNDIIRAHTAYALAQAAGHLTGRFSAAVAAVHSRTLDLLARLETAIDHSDLDDHSVPRDELLNEIGSIRSDIESLLNTAPAGRMAREGLRLVIAGSPNAGKSSLMNFLLQADRAIVSDEPGTTRDTIEDELNIRGIPVRVVDTAGIRDTAHELEQAGIERTRRAISGADLVIAVFDGSRPLSAEDRRLWTEVRDRKTVCVLSKSDLPQVTGPDAIAAEFGAQAVPVSALKQTGLPELESLIADFYFSFGCDPSRDVLVANARQEGLLRNARDRLEAAAESANRGLSEEFTAADVRRARLALEEITGRTTDDAVLDRIFSRFCVGK